MNLLITTCLLLFFQTIQAQSLPKEKTKEEITVFLVGNSTVADKPYKDGNPEKGWGQVFPLYFKEGVKIENHAVNGRSTKSFIDEGRWDSVLNKLKAGDYVFIEFGHNDSKKEDPTRYAAAQTSYRENLQKFIIDVRKKDAFTVLATPIVRRKFDGGKLIETHGEYPFVVREVAKSNDVPLLDLHAKTKDLVTAFGEEKSKVLFLHIDSDEYKNLKEKIRDDTHLSAYGAFKVCDLVAEEIRVSLKELSRYLKK